MKRDLKRSVVVLTGASSGIGRAAALLFAERGADLVLAARDPGALESVAQECESRYGVAAIAVVTDVRDEVSVDMLAAAALERFGRVDVWVNDAAVAMLGSLEACPSPAIRDLFDTNVMGVVHGMRAALACFRLRGSGVLVNVGAAAGRVGYADAGPYSASKHAVAALTESIRRELRETPGRDIHACLVVPAKVDTPLFQHAANFTGREVLGTPPLDPAKRVARAIVRAAEQPRPEIFVGRISRLLALADRVAPWLYEKREHLGHTAVPATLGNVARSLGPHTVEGGWRLRRRLERELAHTALAVMTTGG